MKRLDKTGLARHLNSLMAKSQVLNTNAKVAKRSGVSMNTVRRLRKGEDGDPSLFNVDAVARAFKLSLSEFIASAEMDAPRVAEIEEPTLQVELSAVEQILAKIADLPDARILALGVALGFKYQASVLDRNEVMAKEEIDGAYQVIGGSGRVLFESTKKQCDKWVSEGNVGGSYSIEPLPDAL